MNLPILYHLSHNKKLHSWECWSENNVIYQRYGRVDGQKITVSRTTTGKNVGKSNATTDETQAEAEAKALWKKKKDTKYSETIEDAKAVVFLPMLAHDRRKATKPLVFPVDVQPKLDGVRCMAYWEDGQVVLMSRGGKTYDVAHVVQALEKILPIDFVADGELYIHGKALQDIIHLVKSPGIDEQLDVEYMVFDGFRIGEEDAKWCERKCNTFNIFGNWDGLSGYPIQFVKTQTCTNEEELYQKLSEFENEGFEGVIIRLLDGVYELGHRSRSLWKLKNFQDAEFVIVGAEEGSGIDIGTVIWVCALPNGGTFKARPKGTREQRKEWFDNKEKYFGKLLTVKYQGMSNDDVPIFPVGIAVREDL